MVERPAIGEFITRDPAEALTGDPYAYAANSPLAFTDPLGLWPSWDDVGEWIAGNVNGVEVGVGVCPVFGCLGVSANWTVTDGLNAAFDGGVGLAVAYLGVTVRPIAEHRSGWSESTSVFGSAPIPTDAQVAALADSAAASTKDAVQQVRRRWMIRVAAGCGLRWGEMSVLRAGDVDLEQRTVRVVRAWHPKEPRDRRLGPPKSRHSVRTVVIPEQDVNLWRQVIEVADEGAFLSKPPRSDVWNGSYWANKVWPKLIADIEGWRRVLSVNLDGAFLCFRAAARHMVERGDGGSLVGVSSTSAIHGAPANQAYSVSKTGVLSLVRGLAVELARHGIRANSLVPGWTETDLTAPLLGWERFVDATTARTPVRRWGTPDDFGAAAVFLSDPTLTFHTGDAVVVDGGYTVF